MVFLHEHYAEPLTRQEIAAHVNVSERYVTRCFREELGLTPMEYLNRYRIQRARLLPRESSKSITEIALEVGFSSSAYFSRVFRKEMGISPREYKQNKHVTWD